METIVLSKHWPTVEVSDIEVFCILPGCVQLVLMLPTAAAHVLFKLSHQGVAALTAEGVRCCKLHGRVVRCDAALGIEEHAQSMYAAGLCEAEQAAEEELRMQETNWVMPTSADPGGKDSFVAPSELLETDNAEQLGKSKKRRLQSAVPESKLEPKLEPMPDQSAGIKGEPTLGIKPEPSTKLESGIKPESQSTSAAAAGKKRSGDEAGLGQRSTAKDENPGSSGGKGVVPAKCAAPERVMATARTISLVVTLPDGSGAGLTELECEYKVDGANKATTDTFKVDDPSAGQQVITTS